jgi:hypothetical protein
MRYLCRYIWAIIYKLGELMATINEFGYVINKTRGIKSGKLCRGESRSTFKDWWLVKHSSANTGQIHFKYISLPKYFIGKKVRFHVEIIDDEIIPASDVKRSID